MTVEAYFFQHYSEMHYWANSFASQNTYLCICCLSRYTNWYTLAWFWKKKKKELRYTLSVPSGLLFLFWVVYKEILVFSHFTQVQRAKPFNQSHTVQQEHLLSIKSSWLLVRIWSKQIVIHIILHLFSECLLCLITEVMEKINNNLYRMRLLRYPE